MFKYWKEMRELKRTERQLKVVLLGKLYDLVEGFPDLIELAKRAKDLDMVELQKLLVEEIVKYTKSNKEEPDEEVK